MSDRPRRESQSTSARRLDYAPGGAETTGRVFRSRLRDSLIALLLAIAWVWAAVMLGVGDDFVTIPLATKLGIMASTVIVFFLLARLRNWGCLAAFALFATWVLGVMWFWN